MLIRRLAPDDADAMTALRVRGLREFPRHFGATPEEDLALPRAEIRRRLEAAPVMGAWDAAGALAGMAGLYLDTRTKHKHRAHVWGVYVAPEARRQGVARRLMIALLAAARTLEGIELVQLTVSTDAAAAPARALYASLGFRVYGTEEHALKLEDGTYADEHYMALMF